MLYYSAPNLAILLEGQHVVQAYALEVNSQASVMPYYSWSSREVSDFTDGPIIVTGTLIVNIKETSYLESIVNGTKEGKTSLEKNYIKRQSDYQTYKTELDDLSKKASKLGTIDPALLLTMGRLRKKLSLPASVESLQGAKNSKLFNGSFSIDVVNVGSSTTNTEEIRGVKFTGKSFSINAGSSQNMKYAYPFIAKSFTA
jgi:hypothetical protein